MNNFLKSMLVYFLLSIMIWVWSLSFIVVDLASGVIPILSLSFYRFLIASISYFMIDLFIKLNGKNKIEEETKKNSKFSKNDWILMIIASLIGQSLYFYTLYGAVSLIGPSLPALFVCLLSPVVIAILALWVFDEKLNRIKVLGFLIATFGAFLLVTGGDLSTLAPSSNNFLGYLFMLMTPFQWGIFTIITKKIGKENSMLSMLKYITYLAAVELFLIIVITGEIFIFIEVFLHPLVLFSVFYIGFLCQVVGYYVYQYGQRKIDSSKVASFLYIEPFITLIFSLLWGLEEYIVIWNIIGGIIVLAAVFIINYEKKEKDKK